jgi:hypothetical protein
MEVEIHRQIFEKILSTKFHPNTSSGSRVIPCGETDWRKSICIYVYDELLCVTFFPLALNMHQRNGNTALSSESNALKHWRIFKDRLILLPCFCFFSFLPFYHRTPSRGFKIRCNQCYNEVNLFFTITRREIRSRYMNRNPFVSFTLRNVAYYA